MGYTHYWNFKGNVAPDAMEGGAEKFKTVARLGVKMCDKVRSMGIDICGGDGYFTPTFCSTRIIFNGNEEKGEAHETFAIESNDGKWNFCKTARKPYDLLVCLMLLTFKYVFGDDFEYSSDGITREAYENRDKNEYWKQIGFVPKGVDKGWATAYEVWEQVKAENGITE